MEHLRTSSEQVWTGTNQEEERKRGRKSHPQTPALKTWQGWGHLYWCSGLITSPKQGRVLLPTLSLSSTDNKFLGGRRSKPPAKTPLEETRCWRKIWSFFFWLLCVSEWWNYEEPLSPRSKKHSQPYSLFICSQQYWVTPSDKNTLIFKKCYYLCLCVCACVCVWVPQYVCGGQRTTWWFGFLLSHFPGF